MSKLNKKILITLLLFLAILLMHNAKAFAVTSKQGAFERFENYDFKSTYVSTKDSSVYIGLYDFYEYFKPKIVISNKKVANIEDDDYRYIRTYKTGTTNVTMSATYKGKKVTKKFNIKVVNNEKEERFYEFIYENKKTANLYLGERVKIEPYDLGEYFTPKVKIDNKSIAKLQKNKESDEYYIISKKVGTTKANISIKYKGKTATKNVKIKVVKPKVNTKLESKTNDVVSILGYSAKKTQVLLANGELWNTKPNSFKLTTKATGNVSKYVYSDVYFEEGERVFIANTLGTLKRDNTLKIESEKNNLNIKNVVDYSGYGYLTKSGNYCAIVNKKGKLVAKKKITRVKKLIGKYLVVKKDNKLYTIGNRKICNASVKDALGDCVSGLILNNKGILYSYNYNYETDKYTTKKVNKNVVELMEGYKYKTKSGKIYSFDKENYFDTGYIWIANNELKIKNNGKLYLNDTYIINNVDSMDYAVGTKNSSALIVRKDGSIWRFDLGEKANLTKVRSGKNEYKKITAPSKVKAKKLSSKKVKVSWKNVEGAKKYTIYRATSKNGKYTKVGTSKSNTYKDTKLKKGKTYYYKIVANTQEELYNSNKSSAAKIKL